MTLRTIPPVPNNSLTEEIEKIISLCMQLEEEDPLPESWPMPPATMEEIKEWESKTGNTLPDDYRNWLLTTKNYTPPTWFEPAATEEEISVWENKNGITIPESYKDWLRFSDSANIRMELARFYGLVEMEINLPYLPEDWVLIGLLIGDGEMLCFSKSEQTFIRYLDGPYPDHRIPNFKGILEQTIDSLEGGLL